MALPSSPAATGRRTETGLLSRLFHGLLLRIFYKSGWRVEGTLPGTNKFVLAGAPHTSNFDFVVFLGVADHFGLTPRYIGKHSLFRWPMGKFMRDMGGISVDRRKKGNMVEQVARRIEAEDEMALVIALEGTRSPTQRWRTGFYNICLEANVPFVLCGPDYVEKIGKLGPTIWPTGDYEKDMAPAYAWFRTLIPADADKVIFPDGYGMDGKPEA